MTRVASVSNAAPREKGRTSAIGHLPRLTGGSATGLSATDAWRSAAAGDENSICLIRTLSDSVSVAVIGRRGKGDHSLAMPAFHKRIIIQRVIDPPGPRALDVALAKGAQRRKYPFTLFERSTGHIPHDVG